MTVTYHLFMLAFTFFSASFVFTVMSMGYNTISTASTLVFVVTVFAVESYNQQMLKKEPK